MTLKTADRVFETSTTTETGTLTLLGPVSGFQSFVTGVGNGAKVPYTITQADISGVIVSWECGIGTVTDAASDTLARNTVLRSSNGNAAVNFGAGTKNVYLGFIADIVPTRDENLNFIEGFGVVAGTANALTLTLPVVPKGYSDGMIIKGFATNANTAGATTINVNSLGNKNIKVNGADPVANVLTNGGYFEAVYKSASGWFDLTYPTPVPALASQLTAEAGANNTDYMTSLRVKQEILALFGKQLAKAWVNFDGTGTVSTNQTIRSSHNVTSVFKNGTGDYTVTFTIAMADANYTLAGMSGDTGGAGAANSLLRVLLSGGMGGAYALKTTTQVRITTGSADPKEGNIIVFGN